MLVYVCVRVRMCVRVCGYGVTLYDVECSYVYVYVRCVCVRVLFPTHGRRGRMIQQQSETSGVSGAPSEAP